MSSRTRRAWLAMATALVAGLSAAPSRAQEHDHQFFYSDDAALAAGAVAATTEDSGSIYYNPAGLSLNQRSHADLNASALGVRIRSVDGIMTARLPNDQQALNLRTIDILSTPHAAAITRRIGAHVSVGIGFYVVDYDTRAGEDTTSRTDPASGAVIRNHVDIDLQQSKYLFGPAIGWQVTPAFRVGIGIFGTYATAVSGGRIFLDQSQPATGGGAVPVAFVFYHFRGAGSAIGTRAVAGMQWDLLPSWTLAAVVRSPELQLAAWGSQLTAVSGGSSLPSSTPSANFDVSDARASNAVALSMPPQFIASLARKMGAAFVSAEVDLQPPLRVVSQGIDRETAFNARVGGIFRVSPDMSLGAGFFTDRATTPLALGLPADRIDYYGVTLGGQLRTAILMAQKAQDKPLVLTTTVALRAAVGFGQARTYDIDETGFVPRSTDVTFYELTPYLGSSIAF